MVKQSLRDRIDKTSMREDGNNDGSLAKRPDTTRIDKTSMREDGN